MRENEKRGKVYKGERERERRWVKRRWEVWRRVEKKEKKRKEKKIE